MNILSAIKALYFTLFLLACVGMLVAAAFAQGVF